MCCLQEAQVSAESKAGGKKEEERETRSPIVRGTPSLWLWLLEVVLGGCGC